MLSRWSGHPFSYLVIIQPVRHTNPIVIEIKAFCIFNGAPQRLVNPSRWRHFVAHISNKLRTRTVAILFDLIKIPLRNSLFPNFTQNFFFKRFLKVCNYLQWTLPISIIWKYRFSETRICFLYFSLFALDRYTVWHAAKITEKSRVLTKIGSAQAQYIVHSSASLTFAVTIDKKYFQSYHE